MFVCRFEDVKLASMADIAPVARHVVTDETRSPPLSSLPPSLSLSLRRHLLLSELIARRSYCFVGCCCPTGTHCIWVSLTSVLIAYHFVSLLKILKINILF